MFNIYINSHKTCEGPTKVWQDVRIKVRRETKCGMTKTFNHWIHDKNDSAVAGCAHFDRWDVG